MNRWIINFDNEMDEASPFLPLVPLSSNINKDTISDQILAEDQWEIVFYDSCCLHSHLGSHQW